MSTPDYDVLILGAGAAGLSAAAQLAAVDGISVQVVDARHRVGGRICTVRDSAGTPPVELGAEFIHGPQEATFDLLRAAGTFALDSQEEHWMLGGRGLQKMDEADFQKIRQALKSAGVLRRRDAPFADFLRQAGQFGLSPRLRAFARKMVEGFDAADPERVSAHSIAEEWQSGGATDSPQFRPSEGYASLLHHLTVRLRSRNVSLQLGTVVDSVAWTRGRVEMAGSFLNQPWRATAAKALVTLPVGVMQLPESSPHAVRFSPRLESKQRALEGVVSGPVIKVCMRFREAFWEKLDQGRYASASFFHSTEGRFPTFWTSVPRRVPYMVAWAGGPGAAQLSSLDDPAIVAEAVDCLRQIFKSSKGGGRAFLKPEKTWVHNWQTDPYSYGAYSYVAVGGSDSRKALGRPLSDTLYFAGEATHEEDAGTVAGALRSGQRAAREILKKR